MIALCRRDWTWCALGSYNGVPGTHCNQIVPYPLWLTFLRHVRAVTHAVQCAKMRAFDLDQAAERNAVNACTHWSVVITSAYFSDMSKRFTQCETWLRS